MLFNVSELENIVSNYYHIKPQTWFMSLNKFLKIMTEYLSLKRSWKMLFNGAIFEKLKLFVQVDRLKNCGYKWTLTIFQNDQDHVFQDDNQKDQ